MTSIRILPGLLILVIFGASAARADDLYAGVARVEITPPVGYPMGGYSARMGPSVGIHDPLFATALVLEAEGLRVAFVSCDLRSFPSERVVRLAKERRLVDYVLIAATHNHSGPITWEDQTWPSPERPWFKEVEDRILNAIEKARSEMFIARLGTGFGEVYLGHNRRRAGANGKVEMLWRNEKRLPTSPVDPTVGVIKVSDSEGRLRVVLVNYSCHAVVLGPDNRMISADYPGYAARRIEREFPAALCLFVQGGAGDINPYQDKQPVDHGGFEVAAKVGDDLALEAIRVLRKARDVPTPGLRVMSGIDSFRDRWDTNRTMRAGFTSVLVNRQIAIAALAGEPFVDLQISFRDRCEAPACFMFGYTYSAGGEWLGYIPTIKAAAEGGYGAGYNTRLEVGAGEALIDRALVHLLTMMGKLRSAPSR